MQHTLTFLGTSTSVGIPVIGCDCRICKDPRYHRMRSSVVIESEEQTILVDAGPDLRQQALRHNLRKVDHVLYTHAHLDHVSGFDELRAFCWHRDAPLPLYGNAGCMSTIQQMFPWAFARENTHRGYIRPKAITIAEPFTLGELLITPIPVEHGSIETIGYKFTNKQGGTLVYIPDVKTIPESSMELIGSPDVFILDCLREQEHPAHMCLRESLATIARAEPKRAFLTHCSHEMDWLELAPHLPAGVQFSRDTLQIDF